MRVALVHDWLTGLRGGERCLEAFIRLYPDADVFTLVHVPGSTSSLIDERVKATSWLNRLPGVGRYYRALLPFFPSAVHGISLEGYDLVVSLSHAAAKNVRVPRGTPHICYCFTPMRYIWDRAQDYLGPLAPVAWPLIARLRKWDLAGAADVTHFVAISRFVAARIRRFYGRTASVIHPPVEVGWISRRDPELPGEAFLYAGALVPYKKVDLAIAACNELELPLWIAGRGPLEDRLRKLAGPTVTFLGRVSDEDLGRLYGRCRALLFPATEDFGLIPIECLAAGRPVIGPFAGALRETLPAVRPWDGWRRGPADAAGVFMEPRGDDRSRAGEGQALVRALRYFLDHEEEFCPERCWDSARRYSPEVFAGRWNALVREVLDHGQVTGLGGETSTPQTKLRLAKIL